MHDDSENDEELHEKTGSNVESGKSPIRLTNIDGSSNERPIAKTPTLRESLAQSMHSVTDFVNEHLMIVRYATLSSVLLLGAYAISQTPLFFRYRTTRDIPNSLFNRRRVLTCRVFRVEAPVLASTADVASSITWSPIVLCVKHLSPAGFLLSRNHFEIGTKFSPTAVALGRNDDPSDLIRVQLFGISQYSNPTQQNVLLQELARERGMVRCQVLATTPDAKDDVVAIARIAFWDVGSWWPVDLGTVLVKSGLARVQHDVVFGRNGSDRLQDKTRDIQYLESLSKVEYAAISKRSGMWSIPRVRAASQDTVDHVEWVTTATWYQKLWRRITRRR